LFKENAFQRAILKYNEIFLAAQVSCVGISEERINPDTDRAAFAWQSWRARFVCCQLVQDFINRARGETSSGLLKNDFRPQWVIPAPYQVRDELQQESRKEFGKRIQRGFHHPRRCH
jgi:hypothetical protein